MNWIRNNPHLLALSVVAVLVLAASGLVVMNARGYNDQFESVTTPTIVPPSRIPEPDYTLLDQASAELQKPAQWNPIRDNDPKRPGFVYPFVPQRYSIIDGKPAKSGAGSHYKDRLTQEEIPDEWFIQYALPVTDATVPLQDTDGDGFLNEDEWRGNQITGNRKSTDPSKKDSHPPYYTKLFLKKREPIQFRLRFNAYDGDPTKDKVENMTFQINTLDLRGQSEFLKIGDTVNKTHYKLEKFQYKMQVNPATQADEEVSVLTVRNVETNETVDLIKGKVVDSPDIYGIFTYLWPKQHPDIRVKKLGQFVLLPEKDQLYTLLDIADDHATIKAPSGEELKIVPIPAWYQP